MDLNNNINGFPKLTKKQIDRIEMDLLLGKKHWTQKVKHALGIIKPFYKEITEDQLPLFLEDYVPAERERIKKEFMENSRTGKINTKYTPTDVSNTIGGGYFSTIKNPVIGVKYHLSWAYKGAVFVLKAIEGNYCYLDNPRMPRKELLKAKVEDLRSLRKK
jgi:hypothetical protein